MEVYDHETVGKNRCIRGHCFLCRLACASVSREWGELVCVCGGGGSREERDGFS